MKYSKASDWIEIAKGRTLSFEACVLHKYKDSEGVDTFGWGTNITQPFRNRNELIRFILRNIDDKQMIADYLFDGKFQEALSNVHNLCSNYGIAFNRLPNNVKIVLSDMAYNMGYWRLASFKKMLTGIAEKNWKVAHDECLDSDYGRKLKKRSMANAILFLEIENKEV